jgi:hypothetical protein
MDLDRTTPCFLFLGFIVLGWCFLPVSGARAQTLYRCADGDRWVFQQTRCAPGTGAEFKLSPENRIGSPLRPGERRYLKERLEARRTGRSNIGSVGAGEKTRRSSEKVCLSKSQALERVHRKLRRGYKPTDGERLRRRRDALEEYLSRFCD